MAQLLDVVIFIAKTGKTTKHIININTQYKNKRRILPYLDIIFVGYIQDLNYFRKQAFKTIMVSR